MGYLKEFRFLFNVVFIVSSECAMYCIFRDYAQFIHSITHRLAQINILYVKVFQAIALNNNFIDEKINKQLLRFTDNAPWTIKDINIPVLVDISEKYNLIMDDGYETPINSGMISLVFKAYHRGTMAPMIIKMKRFNIDGQLDDAIENLKTVLYFLSFIPLFDKYRLAELVNKNMDLIRQQTDFMEEVKNTNIMKENCKRLKYVRIPTINKEVTEKYPDCILMDYINGVKITEIREEDYDGFAKQVLKLGVVTTLIHGFAHGDLHGGNILFIKDADDEKYKYKLGIIDFGIVYNIDPEYRHLLFEVATKALETPAIEMAIKLLNSSMIEPANIFQQIPAVHRDNIIQFTSKILDETIHQSKQACQTQVYRFLKMITEYLNTSDIADIGIRPSNNLIKTQMVLAMAHGVTMTLCRGDFVPFAEKVMNELFHTDIIM
jgi:predicted unusual protein kinase regulating ubiquinone biosynthesis (AarF/ABC1/UbiB family)